VHSDFWLVRQAGNALGSWIEILVYEDACYRGNLQKGPRERVEAGLLTLPALGEFCLSCGGPGSARAPGGARAWLVAGPDLSRGRQPTPRVGMLFAPPPPPPCVNSFL